jgi:hypothetical protein
VPPMPPAITINGKSSRHPSLIAQKTIRQLVAEVSVVRYC